MTVRIIDRGPDPKIVKKISCNNCGAMLEYVPGDVKSVYNKDYGGGGDTRYYIICPACHRSVTVNTR